MDDLSAYRSSIGIYAFTAYKKSSQGRKSKQHIKKSVSVKKQKNAIHTTTEFFVETKRNRCTLVLILLFVSLTCIIKRYGYLQGISSEFYLTLNEKLTLSHNAFYIESGCYRSTTFRKQHLQSAPIDNTYVISLHSFSPQYKGKNVNFSISCAKILNYKCVRLKYRNQISALGEEPFRSFHSCDNCRQVQHRNHTSAMGEDPFCPFNSCDNCRQLQYRNQTSAMGEEPFRPFNSCDNCSQVQYRNQTSAVGEEPFRPFNFCDNCKQFNNRNQTSLVIRESLRPFNFCNSCRGLHYRDQTSPVIEELFPPFSFLVNCRQLHYRKQTLSVIEEALRAFNSIHSCRELHNKNQTSPAIKELLLLFSCRELHFRHVPSSIDEELLSIVSFCNKNKQLYHRNVMAPMRKICPFSTCGPGTCSFLLGNKGCHTYKGNPGNKAGEAWLTQETLGLIKKHVDESVGYITMRDDDNTATATGFRVGDCYLMTAYHVFEDKIDYLLKKLSREFHYEGSEDSFIELCKRLEVKSEEDNSPLHVRTEKVINKFLNNTATNISLLFQRLKGIINTEQLTKEFESNWKHCCAVEFTNNITYNVDWKIEFGDHDSDIVIVKLLARQKFPRPLLLDENFMEHGHIHVIRYIHSSTPKVIMDQDTQEFKDDDELIRNSEAAVQWWNVKYPDEPENFFSECYKDCRKCHDEDTGQVVLRTSTSFTHGASGSPIVYSFNSTGQPIVGMIFQKGHPEFYYRAQDPNIVGDVKRFKNIEVDAETCFFDGGTTMKKAAQLLDKYGKHDLKQNIFSLPKDIVHHNVNLEDLRSLIHTEIGRDFTTLREKIHVMDVKLESVMDTLAHHQRVLAAHSHNECTATEKMMVKHVEKWEKLDKKCYITKAMKSGIEKICSENFLSITGVPGSGKTTTMWNIAIYLKNNLEFTLYPILHPKEFENYFDGDKKQVFIFDDVIGEYSVDKDTFSAWKKYNDSIKYCLSKNTKILTSIRTQLWKDQSLQGRRYLFNDVSCCINLGHQDFKLCEDEMKRMLTHYLEVNGVDDVKGLIERVWWLSGVPEEFVNMFPLLCKVFSQNSAVRQDPYKFFRDPFEAMTEIFTQMKTENKHQFCGLVLCSALDLNDDYFSRLSEKELAADKIELRNIIIESLKLNLQDLRDIRVALCSFDGIYVTRVENRYKFSHSLFQNIVTYLYNDSIFVCKYGTRKFLHDRVRINKALPADNKYVLVYNSETDIKRLANRFVQELISDAGYGARFIVSYPCIDDPKLIDMLKIQLFVANDVSQDRMNLLCWECVLAMNEYGSLKAVNTDITTLPDTENTDVETCHDTENTDVNKLPDTNNTNVKTLPDTEKRGVGTWPDTKNTDVEIWPDTENTDVNKLPDTNNTDVKTLPDTEKRGVGTWPDTENTDVEIWPDTENADVNTLPDTQKTEVETWPGTENTDVNTLPDTNNTDVKTLPDTEKRGVGTWPDTENADVEIWPDTENADINTLPDTNNTDVNTLPDTQKTEVETWPGRENTDLNTLPDTEKTEVETWPGTENTDVNTLPDTQKTEVETWPGTENTDVNTLPDTQKTEVETWPGTENTDLNTLPDTEKTEVETWPGTENTDLNTLPDTEKENVETWPGTENTGVVKWHDTENTDIADIRTWPRYGLLSMLLESGADCNTLMEGWGACCFHQSIYDNCTLVTKYLLQHPTTNINQLDKYNRCVLHYAVNNFDMTCYLLDIQTLTCLNQPDSQNRTPLWYVENRRQPYVGIDGSRYCAIPHREEMIEVYKQKGAILAHWEEEDESDCNWYSAGEDTESENDDNENDDVDNDWYTVMLTQILMTLIVMVQIVMAQIVHNFCQQT